CDLLLPLAETSPITISGLTQPQRACLHAWNTQSPLECAAPRSVQHVLCSSGCEVPSLTWHSQRGPELPSSQIRNRVEKASKYLKDRN
uniref:Uncharacterized protein n=1 Tax=Coturnix japonica TaxID=93934 RepID=A0A8C2UBX6_COTJA